MTSKMNFSTYIDFNDYCKKTGMDQETAFKKILENINRISDELKDLKNKNLK